MSNPKLIVALTVTTILAAASASEARTNRNIADINIGATTSIDIPQNAGVNLGLDSRTRANNAIAYRNGAHFNSNMEPSSGNNWNRAHNRDHRTGVRTHNKMD